MMVMQWNNLLPKLSVESKTVRRSEAYLILNASVVAIDLNQELISFPQLQQAGSAIICNQILLQEVHLRVQLLKFCAYGVVQM